MDLITRKSKRNLRSDCVSVLDYHRQTEIKGRTTFDMRRALQQEFFTRRIGSFKETELPCKEWKVDKAFAATWLNNREIAVATKCGCLLRIDAETGKQKQSVNPGPESPNLSLNLMRNNGGGIHSIAMNPSRRFLATGASYSSLCTVLSVDTFTTIQHFKGHQDRIFGVDWMTDVHLVTGSRDRTIRVWRLDEEKGEMVHESLWSRAVHKEKVRDVKFSSDPNRIISFSTDGDVRIWDPVELRGIASQSLQADHSQELACLAVNGYQAALGSRDYIILLDIRTKRTYTEVSLLSPDYSVRSLQFQNHLLSCGCGNGSLSFFDLRAKDFVDLEIAQDKGKSVLIDNRIEVGEGWLDTEGFYSEFFGGVAVHNALYAHCWDQELNRLFICGGPLPIGLRGCYMGIWQ